ncbi:hypothetical protein LELG_05586 [Lodderomyces elongisporus NRRL YB-4239]|uniref:Cytochrome c oxidase assembly protein COX20, mitochondrial n=1 Tax=Lodderomyces elongisporus (strain ATCC 11503 / CBS 2605 / JCM 1781 / NBRC 1676 / NRRL YB-4239) TaxID=379508 RepID=A5E7J7_LODEL|nr:hypothetical protein LELG_05586 [Lodderomyces elongisporus NRRL YB-4239]
MGWFGGGSSNSQQAPPAKVSIVSEYKEEPKPHQQYLEDLPPKFADDDDDNLLQSSQSQSQTQVQPQPLSPSQQRQATLSDAAKMIKLSDFTFDRFVQMPCFREAMITGFQAMGVLGVITFLVHRNFKKSMNWSVGGFFLGNLVGWEQCRSLRRRSFEMVEKAKREKEERHRKKLEELRESQLDMDDVKRFEEFNNRR